MPLLAADSFAYQFYRVDKPQNDRSPCIDTDTFPATRCSILNIEFYYESRKRELKRRLINEGRCDERLKAKVEEVHECDVRTRDPDAMVVPPTPKPTCKAEALARAPPTIASS
jgi:hypothetical protein